MVEFTNSTSSVVPVGSPVIARRPVAPLVAIVVVPDVVALPIVVLALPVVLIVVAPVMPVVPLIVAPPLPVISPELVIVPV